MINNRRSFCGKGKRALFPEAFTLGVAGANLGIYIMRSDSRGSMGSRCHLVLAHRVSPSGQQPYIIDLE